MAKKRATSRTAITRTTITRISRFTCKGCGVLFIPKTRKQKYHNEDCRIAYYEKHYFAKIEVDKTCLNCGETFTTTMPKKQWYCKPECRDDARNKRADALNASKTAEKVTYFGERMAAFERDEYKCTVCGRSVKDGAVLDVVEEGAGLVTVCTECKTGRGKKDNDDDNDNDNDNIGEA